MRKMKAMATGLHVWMGNKMPRHWRGLDEAAHTLEARVIEERPKLKTGPTGGAGVGVAGSAH